MKHQDLNLFYAQIFRFHRQALGISQMELSQRLGISQTAIQFIETGQRPAQIEMLENLAQIVGVSVEDLVYQAFASFVLNPKDP
jgi:transcriptional regulator with XRE-family HTH domain